MKKNDDTISEISKASKCNNSLIDKAALEIEQKKKNIHSESKLEKISSLQKTFFGQKSPSVRSSNKY
jgi:hypothetical protein